MTNDKIKLNCNHDYNHDFDTLKRQVIKNPKVMDIKNPNIDIFDLMLTNKLRFELLKNMDQSSQFENLKRLMDIYRLSGVKKLEKFFIFICIFDDQIDLYLKQDILYLLSYKLTLKNSHFIFNAYSNTLFLMVQKAFVFEEYWLMFENNLILYNTFYNTYISLQTNHKTLNMCQWLKNIIILGFKKLKSSKPFKKIFSLILNFKEETYFEELCIFIFKKYSLTLSIKNNLLLLQIIFKDENEFMDNLFHIAINNEIEINLKLEACDILYLKGSETIKTKVQDILKNILPSMAYTQNPENAHLDSINTSIDKTLNSIIQQNKGKLLPLNLFETLIGIYKPSKEFEKIKGSLSRIFNYNFLKFSRYELTLKEIIENIWLIMEECKPELKQQLVMRLEQELVDMYNTCSQGYVSRLINIFSGYNVNNMDLGITISYEDEIFAIFSNKINTIVSKAPLDIKEKLLEEIMVPSNDYENRLNLIRYLRPHLPQIWNEIFEIFKDELTITDLDLYCRKVTMKYEGC
jgi:hypothetical protein